MKIRIIPLLLAALSMVGCLASPQQLSQQADAIGYGEPLTLDYQPFIKSFMETRLKDAASAIYKFEEPFKWWQTKAPIQGGSIESTGWCVPVLINSKNSYGGYVGFVRYSFIFHDNRLVLWQGENGLWQKN